MVIFISVILTIAATIALTALALIFIVPENKNIKFGKFGKLLHDFLSVKHLLIEYILKGIYVLATVFCVAYGVFMNILPEFAIRFDPFKFGVGWGGPEGILVGILFVVVGPLVVRVIYEIAMLFVLLVKNTMDIRNRICNRDDESPFDGKPDFAEIRKILKRKK